MCTSKAQGGQRCHSHAAKTLTVKHAAKVAAEVAYVQARDSGAPAEERARLLRAGIAAEHAYEDALVVYASTAKGRADLEERLRTAPAYGARRDIDPNRADDQHDLRSALHEGQTLQRRAAETKRAVRAGEMTPEAAKERSRYPNPMWAERRATMIEGTVSRVIGPAA